MGNYELNFSTEYEGILLNSRLNLHEKKLLTKKITNNYLNQIGQQPKLIIKDLNFTAIEKMKKTKLTGVINLEYIKPIPPSFSYPIILEIINEILGFLIISGKQNGAITSHVRATEPIIKILSTDNPSISLSTIEHITGGVRLPNLINLSDENIVISFKNYLLRSENETISIAQFWLYIANSNFTNEGFNVFDDIKRFVNMWSSFNSLYTLQKAKGGELGKVTSIVTSKKKIEEYVYDFLSNQKNRVDILLNLNLTPDKGRWSGKNLTKLYNDASFDSLDAFGNKAHYYFMVILYTLRNNAVHGNRYIEVSYGARVASDFLEGLIKVVIQQKMQFSLNE